MDELLNQVHCSDALELMSRIPDASIDAIITDLPYGTTACAWDTIIPFEPMWAGVKRILKPRGVFVTTASQPFTSALVMSNLKWFKYEWIWQKKNAVDFALAEIRPRKMHENILVFAVGSHNYSPQMIEGSPYIDKPRNRTNNIHGSTMPKLGIVNEGTRYPSSVQGFSNGNNFNQHPTQKPIDLYEYLIRTYTQENDIVLDFCMGSGTTALAARNTNRRFIVGDSSPEYCDIARERLKTEFGSRKQHEGETLADLPLFAAIDTR